MSNQEMAEHLHDILSAKAAMGMGVVAGARRRSGSKTAKRPYRRRAGEGELEDIMELYGRGVTAGYPLGSKGKFHRIHSKVKGSKAAKAVAKKNPWIQHVQAYRAKHPRLSYKEAIMKAKSTYKKQGSKTAKRKVSKKKSKREDPCPPGKRPSLIRPYTRSSGTKVPASYRCISGRRRFILLI